MQIDAISSSHSGIPAFRHFTIVNLHFNFFNSDKRRINTIRRKPPKPPG
ncbi:hypothetical protein RISK_001090 [Rhodopirellula islandica]|uniref:Uncharacterized protein n=1 Tax=Rhodopirellula islandica TaxID=595434 RepID=A0A0J1BJP5_RHOIS|nr:hypothetical protein RISK_001090 [Rhodopirellula islandica]